MDARSQSDLYTKLIGVYVWCYIDKKIDVHEMALKVGRLQVRYWRETKQGKYAIEPKGGSHETVSEIRKE